MYFSTIQEVGRIEKINLSEKTLGDAITSALPEDALAKFLGPVSLLEDLTDMSPPSEIFRFAVKRNIPIVLDTRRGLDHRKVIVEDSAVRIVCSLSEALTLMRTEGEAKKRLILDQELRQEDAINCKILELLSTSSSHEI